LASQPLHPNLARLAAAYDEIIERFSNRQLSPTQARSEIMRLIARDDNGVQWSIDPDSGEWRYRNFKGDLVVSDPPAYGFATQTAHDFSRNPNAFNPDSRVDFQEVDESLLYAPTSLAGSTRRPREDSAKSLLAGSRSKALLALAALAVVVGGFLAVSNLTDEEPADPAAPSAPVETPGEVPAPPAP
jgi:hypothetical protein